MSVITRSRTDAFDSARSNLSRFVTVQARAMAELSGLGWVSDHQAPSDFRSLSRAYARSRAFGVPLPVSDLFCESSIYDTVKTNVAFRYFHDMTHLRLGRGFDLDGEIEVAVSHLDVLRAFGFKPGSIEFELLHGDTLGQTLCATTTGDFPADQLCFARFALQAGLGAAIRGESETNNELEAAEEVE